MFCFCQLFYICSHKKGELAEWSIVAVSKTVVRATGPGVRIPRSPQKAKQRRPENVSKSRKNKVLRDFFLLKRSGELVHFI
jgi:hypothetical protein